MPEPVDHFTEAERLLNETVREDASLPFVRHKLTRAGIHAQLAHVQALRAQRRNPEWDDPYSYLNVDDPQCVTTVEVTDGSL